jgi:hypothetical protein
MHGRVKTVPLGGIFIGCSKVAIDSSESATRAGSRRHEYGEGLDEAPNDVKLNEETSGS